jgi:hypothetical protein
MSHFFYQAGIFISITVLENAGKQTDIEAQAANWGQL